MTRVLIMAGGTGGHVVPALAVAEALRARAAQVSWLGTAAGVEAELVPRAGIDLDCIRIKGVRKSGPARAAAMPFMLTVAVAQAAAALRRRRPDAVLGMGGFAAGPGGLAAAAMRRPLVIHEQNRVVGLTNRVLARLARRRLTGFPDARGLPGAEWVGNPVRRAIAELPPPAARMAGRSGQPLRVLVIGGSRGAAVFNRELPGLFSRVNPRPEIRHQCGPGNAAAVESRYRDAGLRAQVADFIDDMAAAYSWCDALVCRAGALTVAEICAAGVAALLVPYPHAVGDHQTANADWLAGQGAGRRLAQDDFVRGDWLGALAEWQNDRAPLLGFAAAARQLARPEAADAVARVCLEAADG